jgi:hypothetical protein
MRTVNCRPNKIDLEKLTVNNPEAKLMRTYRNVIFANFTEWQVLSDLELELLENVENMKFKDCYFRDANVFTSVLKHCNQLKCVVTESDDGYMFDDLKCEPTDKFQNPVSLDIETPLCKSLACFEKVPHINIRHWRLENNIPGLALFMSNHVVAVTSIVIYELQHFTDEFLQLLVKLPELKLKHLKSYTYDPRHVTQIAQLLSNQKSSLTQLKLKGRMQLPIFDTICLSLLNLETLSITDREEYNIRLSNLKVLPNLKKLTVHIIDFNDGYKLEIGELLRLEHFKLTKLPYYKEYKVDLKQPNATLKGLKLEFQVNDLILAQIPKMFPSLTKLELFSSVSTYIACKETAYSILNYFVSTSARCYLSSPRSGNGNQQVGQFAIF